MDVIVISSWLQVWLSLVGLPACLPFAIMIGSPGALMGEKHTAQIGGVGGCGDVVRHVRLVRGEEGNVGITLRRCPGQNQNQNCCTTVLPHPRARVAHERETAMHVGQY